MVRAGYKFRSDGLDTNVISVAVTGWQGIKKGRFFGEQLLRKNSYVALKGLPPLFTPPTGVDKFS